MGRLRQRVAWIIKGENFTKSALTSYAEDLRALQQKVARLEASVESLSDTRDQRAEQAQQSLIAVRSEVGDLATQMQTVARDLGDRIGSLSQRL